MAKTSEHLSREQLLDLADHGVCAAGAAPANIPHGVAVWILRSADPTGWREISASLRSAVVGGHPALCDKQTTLLDRSYQFSDVCAVALSEL